MSDSTKLKAQEKLDNFSVKIGYPDEWKDYSSMDIKSVEEGGSYASNVMAASQWSFRDNISKIGQKVDKSEWYMAPQTVNAYYNPLNNEIVFPAAILQPPFYDYQADAAVNFGGIGAVIGHEVSHGFDDSGSRFDAKGNLSNWWGDKDLERFQERTGKLVAQFDASEPLPDLNVNGEFTLGENIGDLGGVNAAFDGLQKYWERHGKPEASQGFSPEQRFFLSWATIWRMKMRDEELRTRIATDPHSPGQYRAIGPLVNVDAFYEAFDIKEGDAMYKPESERVKIW
jgi:putative endopeptidase